VEAHSLIQVQQQNGLVRGKHCRGIKKEDTNETKDKEKMWKQMNIRINKRHKTKNK
jgi:hypothetical protein